MRTSRLARSLAALALAAGGLTVATATVTATAPAAHADECFTWSRTLSSGTSGSDVSQLQIRVAGWAGYGVNMAIDGQYGAQTTTAVRNFQSAYGLAADGVAGPATFSTIYALQDPDCTPIHFSYAEASENCGRGLNGNGSVSLAKARENLKRVMWRAEALRHRMGDHPLRVTSGFRDKACDAAVGGSGGGQHTYGTALDLVPADSGTTFCSIAQNARYAGMGGIFGPGYPGHSDHTHVDIRSGQTWSASQCGI